MRDLSTINIRPGMSILSVLHHLNYKPWFALAEFVDNAFQSYLDDAKAIRSVEGRGYVLQVDIELDPNLERISILDNAGGIHAADYQRAFRPAELPPDATGLCEFGMGMKSAACWFCPTWSVRSKAIGEREERLVEFDIDKIVEDSIEELSVTSVPKPKDAHYTEVRLEGVRHFPKGKTIAKIRDHLASIYRIFIREGRIHLHFNGERLSFEDPAILVAPYYREPSSRPKKWATEVDIKLSDRRRVQGFVALREKGSTAEAGLALFRRSRLVMGSSDDTYRPEEIFGRSNSFSYQRIFGELHLTGFDVSHTKDGIRWDDSEEDFIQALREQISTKRLPLAQQAEGYRAKAPPHESKEGARAALGRAAAAIEESTGAVIEKLEEERSQPEKPIPKTLPIARGALQKNLRVTVGGTPWDVSISLIYDDSTTDWLTVSNYPSTGHESPRRLGIGVLMTHPFMLQFCGPDAAELEAIIRLAAGIALSEMIARDAGLPRPGTVRRNLNELLNLSLSKVA